MGVVSREAALRRLDGDLELYREILAIFLEDTPQQIAKLEVAVEEGDMETTLRQAHSIKSAAANVGADDVRQLASEIEVSRGEGEIGVLHNLTRLIRTAFDEAAAEIRAF